jgi:succinate dehydrogenase hydrophobic anchor subunit
MKKNIKLFRRKVKSSQWIPLVARAGFIAKGIIYFSIGLLAFRIAVGIGGQPSGSTQILQHFVSEPFGKVLLSLCLVGLLAHTVWKFINGWYEIEDLGSGYTGLFFRAVEIIVGLIYLSLAYAAYQILAGEGTQSSSESTKIWLSKILTLPGGKVIIICIAVVVIIIGLYQFYYAYSNGFDYRINYDNYSYLNDYGIRLLAKIGLSAWGVVYLTVGFLILQAGIHANPDHAGGLGKALSALQKEPYGQWVLGVTAGGLLIYGIYLFLLSFYHKNT